MSDIRDVEGEDTQDGEVTFTGDSLLMATSDGTETIAESVVNNTDNDGTHSNDDDSTIRSDSSTGNVEDSYDLNVKTDNPKETKAQNGSPTQGNDSHVTVTIRYELNEQDGERSDDEMASLRQQDERRDEQEIDTHKEWYETDADDDEIVVYERLENHSDDDISEKSDGTEADEYDYVECSDADIDDDMDNASSVDENNGICDMPSDENDGNDDTSDDDSNPDETDMVNTDTDTNDDTDADEREQLAFVDVNGNIVLNNGHNMHIESTKEEKDERYMLGIRHRVDFLYDYMRGTRPSYRKIVKGEGTHAVPRGADRATRARIKELEDRQRHDLAALMQAGFAARVLLQIDDPEITIPQSVAKQTDDVLTLIEADGLIDLDNIGNHNTRLLSRIMAEGDLARETFIEKNLGIAILLAKRERKKRGFNEYEYNEIEEEAKHGMISAADRYDPDAGYKFSTYATWWIKQKMFDYINSRSKMIKMPSQMNTLYRRITVAIKGLRMVYQTDEKITPQAICDYMLTHGMDGNDVNVAKIEDALKMRKETISIDTYVTDDGSKTIASDIADANVNIEESVVTSINSDTGVMRLLDMITDEKNKAILTEICEGGMDTSQRTISGISRKYGISPKEVKRRIRDAEAEIRTVLEFREERIV